MKHQQQQQQQKKKKKKFTEANKKKLFNVDFLFPKIPHKGVAFYHLFENSNSQ